MVAERTDIPQQEPAREAGLFLLRKRQKHVGMPHVEKSSTYLPGALEPSSVGPSALLAYTESALDQQQAYIQGQARRTTGRTAETPQSLSNKERSTLSKRIIELAHARDEYNTTPITQEINGRATERDVARERVIALEQELGVYLDTADTVIGRIPKDVQALATTTVADTVLLSYVQKPLKTGLKNYGRDGNEKLRRKLALRMTAGLPQKRRVERRVRNLTSELLQAKLAGDNDKIADTIKKLGPDAERADRVSNQLVGTIIDKKIKIRNRTLPLQEWQKIAAQALDSSVADKPKISLFQKKTERKRQEAETEDIMHALGHDEPNAAKKAANGLKIALGMAVPLFVADEATSWIAGLATKGPDILNRLDNLPSIATAVGVSAAFYANAFFLKSKAMKVMLDKTGTSFDAGGTIGYYKADAKSHNDEKAKNNATRWGVAAQQFGVDVIYGAYALLNLTGKATGYTKATLAGITFDVGLMLTALGIAKVADRKNAVQNFFKTTKENSRPVNIVHIRPYEKFNNKNSLKR